MALAVDLGEEREGASEEGQVGGGDPERETHGCLKRLLGLRGGSKGRAEGVGKEGLAREEGVTRSVKGVLVEGRRENSPVAATRAAKGDSSYARLDSVCFLYVRVCRGRNRARPPSRGAQRVDLIRVGPPGVLLFNRAAFAGGRRAFAETSRAKLNTE